MILITGATGFLGSHLLLHLVENEEKVTIRAIYRHEAGIEKAKLLFKIYQKENLFDSIQWVKADIIDVPTLEIAFQDVEYVYHCAGSISFDPKDEYWLRKTNIEGTANMVNFCLSNKVKKMCYVSSIAAFGDLKPNEEVFTEETEWNPEKPHSDYAISKYGAEMEIWRGQQEGLNVVIVNPGVILGSVSEIYLWQEGSYEIYSKIKNGISFYTKGVTGFVGVADVVKIMFLLMKSPISGERFCLVSENYNFQDIINTIAGFLNIKKPTFYAYPWLTDLVWKLDWIASTIFGQKRKLSATMADALHQKEFFSNEKVKETLKYEFETLETTISKHNY